MNSKEQKTPNGVLNTLANPDSNYKLKAHTFVHCISNFINKLDELPGVNEENFKEIAVAKIDELCSKRIPSYVNALYTSRNIDIKTLNIKNNEKELNKKNN